MLAELADGDRRAGAPRGAREVAVLMPDGGGLANRVTVAGSPRSRFLGLMGRRRLDPQEGLWLVPCRSIHMFFMRTAIDLLFLDREGTVIKAVREMRPWSLLPLSATVIPVRGAHSALELAPGTIGRLGVGPGMRLRFALTGPANDGAAQAPPIPSITTPGE